MMGIRALSLTAVLLLAGCGSGGGEDVEARQLAGIRQIAQEVSRQPGVTCARGLLETQGLPDAPLGSLGILVEGETLTRSQQLDVLRQAARDVWTSDLAVGALSASFPGGPFVGEALGVPGSSVDRDTLETAFGPRPVLPDPLPELDDPGNPDC
jgi:hypothetical protein